MNEVAAPCGMMGDTDGNNLPQTRLEGSYSHNKERDDYQNTQNSMVGNVERKLVGQSVEDGRMDTKAAVSANPKGVHFANLQHCFQDD